VPHRWKNKNKKKKEDKIGIREHTKNKFEKKELVVRLQCTRSGEKERENFKL
jgi:hypothetical protein